VAKRTWRRSGGPAARTVPSVPWAGRNSTTTLRPPWFLLKKPVDRSKAAPRAATDKVPPGHAETGEHFITGIASIHQRQVLRLQAGEVGQRQIPFALLPGRQERVKDQAVEHVGQETPPSCPARATMKSQTRASAADYPALSVDKIWRTRFKLIPGARTLNDLETDEMLNLLRTLKRLLGWKQRRELARLLRAILTTLALYRVWPPRSTQPDAHHGHGRSPAAARAMHTLCSHPANLLQRPCADCFYSAEGCKPSENLIPAKCGAYRFYSKSPLFHSPSAPPLRQLGEQDTYGTSHTGKKLKD